MNRKDTTTEALVLELYEAKMALAKMYRLRGGLAKPSEHAPTREALRTAEEVLYGHATTR